MAESHIETEQKAEKSKDQKIWGVYKWIVIMIPGVVFLTFGVNEVSGKINAHTSSWYIVYVVLAIGIGAGVIVISMFQILSALDKYIPSDDESDRP